jgi:glc operon protein GlcG
VSEPLLAEKKIITLALAKRLMAVAEGVIAERGWAMYVAFTDDGGTPLLVESVNRAQPASYDIAVRKAQAAARFRRPTKVWDERVKAGAINVMSLPGVVASEGGLPLVVAGGVVGAVGVSGGTGVEDGVVAQAVAAALAELV